VIDLSFSGICRRGANICIKKSITEFYNVRLVKVMQALATVTLCYYARKQDNHLKKRNSYHGKNTCPKARAQRSAGHLLPALVT